MTNYEYYGSNLNNLHFEDFNVDDNFVCIKISYIPAHSKEEIPLFSKLVVNDRKIILNEKTKWLLKEVEFPYTSEEYIVNVDTMYVPKHAKIEKKYKYCFEG